MATTTFGGVPEHFNLPWELAIADLADELDVRWREFPDGSGAMARALGDGSIGVAIMLTTSTLKAVTGGLEARIVGTHVPSPLRWGIHVAAESDIATVDEIRGRSIAISRQGSGSHLVPIVDAIERGWPLDEQSFVEVGTLAGAEDALRKGEADVFFWEQFMTQPLVDRGVFRRVDVRPPPWPSFLVVARDDASIEDDEMLRLLARVDVWCQKLAADPKATAARIHERFEIDAPEAEQWMELTDWRTLPSVSRAALERASHYLNVAFGTETPPPEALVAPSCTLTP